MKIILGSKSKGRKQILEEMGMDFEIMVSDIDEKAIRFDDAEKLVLALARAKAEALKPKIFQPAILITSDQVVVCNKKIIEKPDNEKQAREFLQGYSNFPARTVTSVVVINLKTGKQAETVDTAEVYFTPFSEDEITDLINEGEIFHLAGGFTVDGQKWEKHIQKIQGTRDSVMGLPKTITEKLIKKVHGK